MGQRAEEILVHGVEELVIQSATGAAPRVEQHGERRHGARAEVVAEAHQRSFGPRRRRRRHHRVRARLQGQGVARHGERDGDDEQHDGRGDAAVVPDRGADRAPRVAFLRDDRRALGAGVVVVDRGPIQQRRLEARGRGPVRRGPLRAGPTDEPLLRRREAFAADVEQRRRQRQVHGHGRAEPHGHADADAPQQRRREHEQPQEARDQRAPGHQNRVPRAADDLEHAPRLVGDAVAPRLQVARADEERVVEGHGERQRHHHRRREGRDLHAPRDLGHDDEF
mmetsp:Transcript_33375/g.113310  ORF Transcript_33375/g.113310 Transcript_33375/m.113310 type:complete len:281 (+) Transcript_33375:580-1422(+)